MTSENVIIGNFPVNAQSLGSEEGKIVFGHRAYRPRGRNWSILVGSLTSGGQYSESHWCNLGGKIRLLILVEQFVTGMDDYVCRRSLSCINEVHRVQQFLIDLRRLLAINRSDSNPSSLIETHSLLGGLSRTCGGIGSVPVGVIHHDRVSV